MINTVGLEDNRLSAAFLQIAGWLLGENFENLKSAEQILLSILQWFSQS